MRRTKYIFLLLCIVIYTDNANYARVRHSLLDNNGIRIRTNKIIDHRKYDFIVSKDKIADFQTIQEAFDAIPDSNVNHITIFIRNGTYKEKLVLPENKINVSVVGENKDSTIVTYDDFSGKVVHGDTLDTHHSCSFRILADNFRAENITFENSAGRVGQAVAVEVNSDKISFINCRFIGNQDTYYTNSYGRIYMKDCYIEGTTDFIFGKSITVFENCTIHSKKHSYITAASTPKDYKYGYVFLNCTLTADSGITKVYLGRPWRDYAQVVFIDCYLGDHIVPEGWHNWNKPWREQTAFYAEYNCRGPGADRSGRVKWSYELSIDIIEQYTVQQIFAANTVSRPFADNWLPED